MFRSWVSNIKIVVIEVSEREVYEFILDSFFCWDFGLLAAVGCLRGYQPQWSTTCICGQGVSVVQGCVASEWPSRFMFPQFITCMGIIPHVSDFLRWLERDRLPETLIPSRQPPTTAAIHVLVRPPDRRPSPNSPQLPSRWGFYRPLVDRCYWLWRGIFSSLSCKLIKHAGD